MMDCDINCDTKCCTYAGYCLQNFLAVAFFCVYISIPVYNLCVVLLTSSSDDFDATMYAYIALIGCECLMQILLFIPVCSIVEAEFTRHLHARCFYIIPYYHYISAALLVVNCTFSMLKCTDKIGIGHNGRILVLVVCRCMLMFMSMCFYHLYGHTYLQKLTESQQRGRRHLIFIAQRPEQQQPAGMQDVVVVVAQQ